MAEQHPLVGQIVDQYRIQSYLASGGMADLFLAEDENLKREAVLKVMLPHLARDEDFVTRFRREGRITAQLEHPHIVPIYGFGFTPDERPYLAMQYIRGGSLQDRLVALNNAQQLMSTRAALTLVRQIADALGVAHAANIVHRDLKPSNILLHPDGMPVLTDLGIASVAATTRLTQSGAVMGTPYYMSPEQARGQTPDGRSDLYALGIILHELLTGQLPFQAESPVAVLHMQIFEPPPPLEQRRAGLSAATYTAVATCLQKEPGARYQTATALVAALDTSLEAEGVPFTDPRTDTGRQAVYGETIDFSQVVRPPPLEPVAESASRRNLWLALIPVGVLLLVV